MTQALGIAQGRFGRVALLDMDTSLVGHAHHHCHMLLKVAGSDSSFVVGDRILPMRDDTAVLVNAWERHQYQHSAQAPRTVFLALYIEPSWIAEIDRSFAPFGQAGFFAQNCVAIGPEIRRLGQDLAHCLAAGSEDARPLIGDIVLSAMHRGAEHPGLPGPARMLDFRIRRALRIMRDDPAAANGLDALAQSVGLSRPHFNHLFRQCTGISPALYNNAIRLEQGVSGLAVQRQTVAAVSDHLGFSAQSNFSRFFSQHTGVTPSSFSRVVNVLDGACVGQNHPTG